MVNLLFFLLDNWLGLDKPLYHYAKVNIDENQLNATMNDFNLNMDWDWSLLNQILSNTIISRN